jgi:uncharacterized membrane protein YgaE (UPF0421/DUF939 family)
MKDIIRKINIIKIIKIAVGACVAILLAELIGLKYSTSAGIITLLSILDTKKETIKVAFKRILAFIVSIIIAYIIFYIFGYSPVSFGIYLLIFISLCNIFTLQDGISMCAVLTARFLVEESMKSSLIVNEVMLMSIGVFLGIILNLYIPSKAKAICKDQHKLEEDIKKILSNMSKALLLESKENYDDLSFAPLDKHIDESLARAYQNMNNTLLSDTKYYIDYIKMRKTQSEILRIIYSHIILLNNVPKQSHVISDYIQYISESFHEYNNANDLLSELNNIKEYFKKDDLPIHRDEFESRAVLFQILHDLELFLLAKNKFVQSLSSEQIKRYWKGMVVSNYENSISKE